MQFLAHQGGVCLVVCLFSVIIISSSSSSSLLHFLIPRWMPLTGICVISYFGVKGFNYTTWLPIIITTSIITVRKKEKNTEYCKLYRLYFILKHNVENRLVDVLVCIEKQVWKESFKFYNYYILIFFFAFSTFKTPQMGLMLFESLHNSNMSTLFPMMSFWTAACICAFTVSLAQ